MSLLKVAAVCGTGVAVVLAVAAVNIWVGILAMLIVYNICESVLSD